jgi:Peptidase of plants and bacteria
MTRSNGKAPSEEIRSRLPDEAAHEPRLREAVVTHSLPAIHLRIHPITHDGASVFTANVPDIGIVLKDAVSSCWKLVYDSQPHLIPQNVRSITLFVRPMGGVAYTTGSWMDGENKEIHFSADYIQKLSKERARDEIRGVIVHEMVHVWQHNGIILSQD